MKIRFIANILGRIMDNKNKLKFKNNVKNIYKNTK